MRIVYAIILALYLVGCDDGKKADVVGGGNGGGGGGLETTGGHGLAPEIVPESPLDKARNELIKAVVDEHGIPSHPHRMFMDFVNYVPKADDFNPSLLYNIKSVLANIDDQSLPVEATQPKAKLIVALGTELKGAISFIFLKSAAQFLLTRDQYNAAEQLRRQIDSASSDSDAIRLQGRLGQALLEASPPGSVESLIGNQPGLRDALTTPVQHVLGENRKLTPPELDDFIPNSPLIPWKIVEKGKRLVQLEAAKDQKAETTRSEYFRMISEILSAEHPVMKAWKNVPQGGDFATLHQATMSAKDECVAVFPKLEKDPFYEAIHAYRVEIMAKDISDSDRIKAQEKLIAAIPSDRAEPIKELLEAYMKAKAEEVFRMFLKSREFLLLMFPIGLIE